WSAEAQVREMTEIAAPAMAPDDLLGMIVRALPAGPAVEVVDDRSRQRLVEAEVQNRLIPAEQRAIAKDGLLVAVQSLVQPNVFPGREADASARDDVLERRD